MIEPIRDVEELAGVYAAVLDNAGPPDDIERVLDGVSRFCSDSGTQFPVLTAALAEKADRFLRDTTLWPMTSPFDGRWDPRFSLSALALAWIHKEPVRPTRACHGLGSFLTARVAEVAVRVANGVARPLAALPSHAESWLDPLILVERLHQHPEPGRLDLIQALLRLSGGNRARALEQAHSLPGPTGRIVRFALGSEDCRRPPRFYDAALWEAAGQARDPEGGAGVHRLRWFTKTYEVLGKPLRRVQAELESWPGAEMDCAKPAALTAVPGTQDPAMLRWCATVWPAHREAWFAAGSLALARNLDGESPTWANRIYLDTLAAYRGAYGPMAYQLLALGLASKETGEGIAASEALVAALRDGRVTGERLGEVCVKLAAEGRIAVSRWVKRFAVVSRTADPAFAGELRVATDRVLAASKRVAGGEVQQP